MAAILNDQKYDQLKGPTSTNPAGATPRSAVSCSECQRRKQKCDKDWPCGHCKGRRVAHLCTYVPKTSSTSSGSKKGSTVGEKRKGSNEDDLDHGTSNVHEVPDAGQDDDMADWGYMPGTDRFNVDQPSGIKFYNAINNKKESPAPLRDDQIDRRPPEIPTRTLTDHLVQHYLGHFNYHYYCTYPPAFLEEYVDWWAATVAGKPLSKSFTSLILRIIACSVQWLKGDEQKSFEYEMADTTQNLTVKYFAAADRLSQQTAPGKGGLHQIEQLFLSACWLKAEARFVESWHALGVAIREAQEQGLHQETVSNGVETREWTHALRRRVWCVLYVWDFYMAGWLGRPLIIDHSNCHIDTRLLRIDQAGTGPDPFAHVGIQCELIQIVSALFAKFGGKPTPSDLLHLQSEIDAWRKKLPSFLKLDNEDKAYDDEHKFVQHQRLQLHATVTMMALNPLKPFLVRPAEPNPTAEEVELRQMAVQKCVDLLRITMRLYDLGVDPKDHLVIFCLFDTAATACSGVIHGIGLVVGRDMDLRDVIDGALWRLAELAPVSKPGETSWRILARLAKRLTPLGPETKLSAPKTKRIKNDSASADSTSNPSTQGTAPTSRTENASSNGDTHLQSYNPTYTQYPQPQFQQPAFHPPMVHPPMILNGDIYPDPMQHGALQPVIMQDPMPWISPDEFNPNTYVPQQWNVHGADFSGFDYAGLEQVWNWQTLNLDPVSGLPLP